MLGACAINRGISSILSVNIYSHVARNSILPTPVGGIKPKTFVEIDCSCLVSLSSYKTFVPTALGTSVPFDEYAA
jgi:hypothetical protein